MKSFSTIKCVLFDFGGCLDSDGVHSRQLFWDSFSGSYEGEKIDYNIFQEAYSNADKKIVEESLVRRMNLQDMNETFISLIVKCLDLNVAYRKTIEIANKITQTQAYYLDRNKKLLEYLNKKYLLGIISNFSGNLEIILKEFSLRNYFSFVIDSYYLKVQKPDPRIFLGALSRIENTAQECVFIGDNPDRDIRPALDLGMDAILISSRKCKQSQTGDDHFRVYNLLDLREYF